MMKDHIHLTEQFIVSHHSFPPYIALIQWTTNISTSLPIITFHLCVTTSVPNCYIPPSLFLFQSFYCHKAFTHIINNWYSSTNLIRYYMFLIRNSYNSSRNSIQHSKSLILFFFYNHYCLRSIFHIYSTEESISFFFYWGSLLQCNYRDTHSILTDRKEVSYTIFSLILEITKGLMKCYVLRSFI